MNVTALRDIKTSIQLISVSREKKETKRIFNSEERNNKQVAAFPNSQFLVPRHHVIEKWNPRFILFFIWHMKARKHLDLDGCIQRLLLLGCNSKKKYGSVNLC